MVYISEQVYGVQFRAGVWCTFQSRCMVYISEQHLSLEDLDYSLSMKVL